MLEMENNYMIVTHQQIPGIHLDQQNYQIQKCNFLPEITQM